MKGGRPDRVPIQLFATHGYDPKMETYGDNYRRLLAYARENADMLYAWREPQEQVWAGMYSGVALSKQVEQKEDVAIKTVMIETPAGQLTQISQVTPQTVKLKKPFVADERDFEILMSVPFVPYRPDTDGYFALRRQVGEKGVITITLPGPVGLAGYYLQPEEFAMWTVEHKDKLHALLDRIRGNMSDFLGYLLDKGVGELFWIGGAEDVIPPLGPPEHYDEFVHPYEKPLVDQIHDYDQLVLLHCHGSIKKVIHQICRTGYDGTQPVEAPPMGDITMAQAKEATGGKMCLIGNIQIGDLYLSNPQKIEAMCRQTIQHGKPGGGFILGVTAHHFSCPMDDRTLANFLAYINAGLKFGEY